MTAEVAPWPPTRWSGPLDPGFRSAADPYLPALRFAWRASRGYDLEEWQVLLIRAIFEIVQGRLRYRQVLVSMGRQNGKSEIAAALGLLILLMRASPLVIGIASSAEQARIVYVRTMQIIRGTAALHRRFAKLTDTRGIQTKTGGRWEIKAARSGALQGLPIDLGVVDEVHLLEMALWTALVNGTGGRDDCLVAGITTAGDEGSELLLHLYGLAESGDAGETFGFFIWEAPEARVPKDDDELGHFLRCANPSLASGRLSLENVIADVRSMPDVDVIRYRLNRFVSAVSGFLPAGAWELCATETMPEPPAAGVVLAVDRSPDWSYASVVAAWQSDGVTYAEVVALVTRPTKEKLVELCAELAACSPRAFVMDRYGLGVVGDELKRRGVVVEFASLADIAGGSAFFWSQVSRRTIRHPGDPVMRVQLAGARRKNVGEGFRVTRAAGAMTIDTVMAYVLACYFADSLPDLVPQLFV